MCWHRGPKQNAAAFPQAQPPVSRMGDLPVGMSPSLPPGPASGPASNLAALLLSQGVVARPHPSAAAPASTSAQPHPMPVLPLQPLLGWAGSRQVPPIASAAAAGPAAGARPPVGNVPGAPHMNGAQHQHTLPSSLLGTRPPPAASAAQAAAGLAGPSRSAVLEAAPFLAQAASTAPTHFGAGKGPVLVQSSVPATSFAAAPHLTAAASLPAQQPKPAQQPHAPAQHHSLANGAQQTGVVNMELTGPAARLTKPL